MAGKLWDRLGQSFRGTRSVVSEPTYRHRGSSRGRTREVEAQLTQSVFETPLRSSSGTHESFIQSLPLTGSDKSFKVYKPRSNAQRESHENEFAGSALSSVSYKHNISNPDLRKIRSQTDTDGGASRYKQIGQRMEETGQVTKVRKVNKMTDSDLKERKKKTPVSVCNCRTYHSHTFQAPKMPCLTHSHSEQETEGPKRSTEVEIGSRNQMTIGDMFWKASLTFSQYRYGERCVDFTSLWPTGKNLQEELRYGIEETGLRDALWELCLMSIVCGPLDVLKSLLDMEYIRVDYQFDSDASLVHLACVVQNPDAIQFLVQRGVSPKLKDKSGKNAGEVCFSSKTRKQLPAKYQSSILGDRNKSYTQLKPGLHDKDSLFKIAANPKCFYEVQKKLQIFDFNVNTESNEDGDFLIHVACKAGLAQLPLIMSLVRLHGANIEMCNSTGLTPLMIAARDGDSDLCDILMCLFGANPDKQNERNGKTALHYAALGNHVRVVNCLIKRAADVNIDDMELCRPDDLSPFTLGGEDCRQIILQQRAQRSQELADQVQQDVIYPIDIRATDMRVVDGDGDTPIMVAAKFDRVHNLETLLGVSADTKDAQNCKTGMTALAMAAKAGHPKGVAVLLRFGANPSIPDMKGYLPLHQAVLKNHESSVEAMLEFFPAAYVGLHTALRLCAKSSIHDKLTTAWERRQKEIIIPQLRMCALKGDAETLYNILEEGDSVNCKSDLNEEMALFVAVENCHLEVVKILVEKGADLRRRDVRTGNTVLHIVARTGHLDTAKYVLEFCCPQAQNKSKPRIDINAVNNERKTALQIAAEKGYIRLITFLINRGATTALLNARGVLFTSPEFEGARIQIETHRQQHTKEIMKLVSSKSKKALTMLESLWLPRFDHNLRDKNGDTPLMVACRQGRLPMVQFLLQSAVYANLLPGDDSSDNNSDADSGVPEITPWKSKDEQALAITAEELMKSVEKSGEENDNLPLGASWDGTKSLNPSALQNTIHGEKEGHRWGTFLTDVERPKGLYIYHDGIVSHVCAVNLFDGSTPLHHAIEGGDNPAISHALLDSDTAVINMQNDAGLTPTHLACKLGRKKILQQLLSVSGVDLNLFTLNGHLPEEMTTNKSIINMVQKTRKELPERPPTQQFPPGLARETAASFTESLPSNISSHRPSTINFDWIQSVYESMVQGHPQTRQAKNVAEYRPISKQGNKSSGPFPGHENNHEATRTGSQLPGETEGKQGRSSSMVTENGAGDINYSYMVSTMRPSSPPAQGRSEK